MQKEKNRMNIFEGTNVKVIDIETTGLDKQLDTIIELGVIEFENGEYVGEHSRIFGGGSSSPELVRLHGISDEQRIGLPRFEECAEKIASYLSNSILVGYNIVKFDIPMMKSALGKSGYEINNYKTIDVFDIVKKYRISSVNYKLNTVCCKFGIKPGNHRSLSDGRCTWELLRKIVQEKNVNHIRELM